MDLLSLVTAAAWVDFLTVVIAKYTFTGEAIRQWYNRFQYVAVLSDVLSVTIGVLLAHLLFPKMNLVLAAVLVQVAHDVIFGTIILPLIPAGHNTLTDVLKLYENESSYGILIYDALMMALTVLLMNYLSTVRKEYVILSGLIAAYSLTYIIYTNP